MNHSYESESTVSVKSSYDLNTAFVDESFKFISIDDKEDDEFFYFDCNYLEATKDNECNAVEAKKMKITYATRSLKKCKKICAKLIKKLKLKPSKDRNVQITSVLVVDLSSEIENNNQILNASEYNATSKYMGNFYKKHQNFPQVDFNSENFAFVGDIFYCYI